MKKLEELKKRLPRGIDVRISSKNIVSFRVRIRKRGYPDQIKTFPDEKLAKQWLSEQERNALIGIHLPHIRSTKHTLSEAIDRYINEELPKKPKNARNVRQHLEWFRKELGDYSLSAIRPRLINEKIISLESGFTPKGKPRSPTTVLRYLTSLSHLFTIAVKNWEWVNENPITKIKKPKANPGRQRYLSNEEKNRLFKELRNSTNPNLLVIVMLALSTGMRRGEIIHLRWQDVDIENQKISLKTTKNGRPRNIPCIGQTFDAILELKSSYLTPSDLLFPSPTNKQKPYDFQSAWKGALKRAQINDFTFHDLRHSTASYLAANKRTLYEIGNLLGHESPQTTKRYAHLGIEHTSQMIRELDQQIFGEKNDSI
ncbi:MAG: site-specific integrase [Chlamydiia bacterium]|nr:site-specific integrase [Chlamydiia bacterium]